MQFNNNGAFGGISGATTDGTTLSIPTGNVLSIIDAPTADTDAANKLYVDTIAVPNTGTANALQYNNGGVFGSTTNITYNGTNLISSTLIKCEPVPTAFDDLANMLYVDTGLFGVSGAPTFPTVSGTKHYLVYDVDITAWEFIQVTP